MKPVSLRTYRWEIVQLAKKKLKTSKRSKEDTIKDSARYVLEQNGRIDKPHTKPCWMVTNINEELAEIKRIIEEDENKKKIYGEAIIDSDAGVVIFTEEFRKHIDTVNNQIYKKELDGKKLDKKYTVIRDSVIKKLPSKDVKGLDRDMSILYITTRLLMEMCKDVNFYIIRGEEKTKFEKKE